MSDKPFVERTFTVDGVDVPCRFFLPVQDGNDFRCRYEIEWEDKRRSFEIWGVDGVQALLLAMMTAHSELEVRRDRDGKDVRYLGGRRLGLPPHEPYDDVEGGWTSPSRD